MSLYRQLWLALILTALLALAGSLLASTFSTRAYLAEQLRLKNADNATALALVLSRGGIDRIEVELAVAAMFDTGHYELIRVDDPFGEPIVERVASADQTRVPDWFTRRLPIAVPAGEALINDGWKQVGKITLVSHSRFAYAALWESTRQLVATLAFFGFLGGYLGTLVLRRLKRPLDTVTQQAKAITERRFVTSPEPDVPELRQLSVAMNFAVTRLKAMFEEEAARLEQVRKDANNDPLTGLANRGYFMAHLGSLLKSPDAPGGTLVLIRIAGLADMNHRLGRTATDQLLSAAGNVLQHWAAEKRDAIAARLNGADFALLISGEVPSLSDAQKVLADIEKQIGAFALNAPVFIGLAGYSHGMELSQVLAQVDNALAKAEATGTSNVNAVSNAAVEVARGEEQWGAALRIALESRWARLDFFPVVDFAGGLIHRECPLRLQLGVNGRWQPAGEFLPMAERLDMTAEIDLEAVSLGLQELQRDRSVAGIAINLSGRSLAKESFRKCLIALLTEDAEASSRLSIEIAEIGALSYFGELESFCRQVKAAGCKLGLEHCGRQFGQIGRFHGLPLDYLKIDASFIRGIDQHAGNQAFLKGLTAIAHGIGLQVIAEGVMTQDELQALQLLGFDGATGPAIKR